MKAAPQAAEVVVLEPANLSHLASLCGPLNRHIRELERHLDVRIVQQGNRFSIAGDEAPRRAAARLLKSLYAEAERGLTLDDIQMSLQPSSLDSAGDGANGDDGDAGVRIRKKTVRARGRRQAGYLRNMERFDLTFGIGPAGTGKTWLAVARAVEILERGQVGKLVLIRPAVEAGERLGFLPGDFSQKIDPYLRPIYDALYEMVGFDRVNRLIERGVIEVAPLAYMRGRSLNGAFIILDEAQNTTVEQMKMFLTRIGFGSKAVVTGDITQVDLPRGAESGLRNALSVLQSVGGIGFSFFESDDVIRHPLVRKIVNAYDRGQGASS